MARMRPRLGSMSPGGEAVIPNAVEFPSQRRERVDWHKLASVDLHDLASGCSIEFLQENISHVTFCDAEAEFDVTTVSGQRNLFKMYRLAQLIIQYLFLSQEFIENQLQQSQEEVQRITEKHQLVKSKLSQQVEEAKKMKATNKSMRETVKYVNSVALANGMFQPSKCPLCCKTFRDQEYLQSHLWRKHPNQAGSIVLPQTSATHRETTLAANVDNIHLEIPSAGRDLSAPIQESPKANDVDSYRLLEIERKFDRMNENFSRIMMDLENQKSVLERENEKRQEEIKKAWEEKNEIERGYKSQLNKLNEHISQLQNAGGKDQTTSSHERLIGHIRKQDKEINALRSQMENQSRNTVVNVMDNDLVDGISQELQDLKTELHEQRKNHKRSLAQIQDSLRKEYEDALEKEKTRLRVMMKDIARHEASVEKAVSKVFPRDIDYSEMTPNSEYQEHSSKRVPNDIPKEIERSEITRNSEYQGHSSKRVSQKPPPSPNVSTSQRPQLHDKSTKTPVKSPEMYEDSVRTFSLDSGSDSLYGTTQKFSADSETESETDTSEWNKSDLKIQHLQIGSTDNENQTQKSIQTTESDQEFGESHSESEGDSSVDEGSSESLTLDTLLKENPKLWTQMRSATEDVLNSKLSLFGLKSSVKSIKSEVLTSCLSKLRKDRRAYEDKYNNFHELRKRLENEINTKIDDKIENAEVFSMYSTGTNQDDKKRKESGVLSRVVHNVRSKVKERSRALSKTGESVKSGVKGVKGIFQSNSTSNDVTVIPRPGSGSLEHQRNKRSKINSSSSDTESDESTAGSAQVEVHNETLKSISRNVFGDDALPGGSGLNPRKGNFFENKTYGKADEDELSEWDSGSEHDYENVRKAKPPKRTDSLDLPPGIISSYPGVSSSSWEVPESKPIKLKKPTGEKVSSLSQTIELQLGGRKKSKMAGAIDVMSGLPGSSEGGLGEPPGSLVSTPAGSQQNIHSISDSSNTVPTSLWGSNEGINKGKTIQQRLSTRRAVPHMWDSGDDLEINDLE